MCTNKVTNSNLLKKNIAQKLYFKGIGKVHTFYLNSRESDVKCAIGNDRYQRRRDYKGYRYKEIDYKGYSHNGYRLQRVEPIGNKGYRQQKVSITKDIGKV